MRTTVYLLIPVSLFDDTLRKVERWVYLQSDYSAEDSEYTALQATGVFNNSYLDNCAHRSSPLSAEVGGANDVEGEVVAELVPDSKHRYSSRYISRVFQRQSTLFCRSLFYTTITAMLFFAFFLPLLLDLLAQKILFIVYIFVNLTKINISTISTLLFVQI